MYSSFLAATPARTLATVCQASCISGLAATSALGGLGQGSELACRHGQLLRERSAGVRPERPLVGVMPGDGASVNEASSFLVSRQPLDFVVVEVSTAQRYGHCAIQTRFQDDLAAT